YAEVTDIEPGRVHLIDRLTGHEHTLRARQIVNAAGVWSDTLSDDGELAPSKGSHILVPAARLGCPQAAITAPVPGRYGRSVSALTWHNSIDIIAMTDVSHRCPTPERAHPDNVEEMLLLSTINAVLDDELTPEDIVGGYAGFRPLIRSTGASKSTGASGSA